MFAARPGWMLAYFIFQQDGAPLHTSNATSVVFRVKSKGPVSGFCGRVMLGSSAVRGLHFHGSSYYICVNILSG